MQNSRLTLLPAFVLALLVLALNTFVLGPWMMSQAGVGAANLTFILVRIATLAGFAFWLAYGLGKTRWPAIRLGSLVGFFDQVVFKSLALGIDYRQNPAAWEGASAGTVLFGLSFSFILFFPAILVICLIGAEVGRHFARTAGGGPPAGVSKDSLETPTTP